MFCPNHTYLLHWEVLLEKLTGLQPVKKFPTFHGTRRFITAVAIARHLSLSWCSPNQSISPYPTFWRSILILSSHLRLGSPKWSLSFRFPHHSLLRSYQSINPGPMLILCFGTWYGKQLLAPRPTPKREERPLSTVRGCLFNIFAVTLHIADRYSTRDLKTRHAVVTGTHSSRPKSYLSI